MQDDEYELMPRNELEFLRKEVEKLKRNPLGDTQASISLLESINKLNANISRMNDIFAGANDDMVKGFSDANLQEQLRNIRDQQEKLARGIVAVGEMVKKIEEVRAMPLPSLDQFIPSKPTAQPLPSFTQEPPAMPQPAQQRNPFEEPGRNFAPLLNQPLPRPMGRSDAQLIPDDDIPLPPRRQ